HRWWRQTGKERLPPVNGHLEPPAGTPQEPVAPSCPQDTKPSSTRVVFSVNLQSAPESLDPGTLRLLWRQRELEIQALRWAIQNHHDARHCHVLHEVAGLPPERSACNQEKVLQNQVQKLTLQLKEQKEQAQLEKSQLEERLLQTMTMMQQLEAELQAFQKSCLLQLAQNSWVGRILRSSTGSVEVVTAETLMDFSDLSESEQGPSTGEGFRLEDVDWNSIAQRYPNLFINIESNSDQKHPRPLPPPQAPLSDEWGSELRRHCMEQRLKSVEWSSLPLMGTSSSGGADSDSSSDQLAERYRVRKVSGHPTCTPGPSSSDLTEAPSDFSREMQTHGSPTRTQWRGAQASLHSPPPLAALHPSPTGSCLKIVAVNGRERSVRVLNQSLEETADLGGLTLQQRVRDFPVCMYRFPPGTLLAPRHHVTVPPRARSVCFPVGGGVHREPHSTGVTAAPLPAAPQVLSEHRDPHCVSPVSRIFADNTDLSIDRFPLSEAESAADTCEQRPGPQPSRAGRVREARARPGWVPRVPWSPLPPRPHPCKNPAGSAPAPGPLHYCPPGPAPPAAPAGTAGSGLRRCCRRRRVPGAAGGSARAWPGTLSPAQGTQTHLQGQEGANTIQVSQAAASQPQHLQVAQGSAQVSVEGRVGWSALSWAGGPCLCP
uniref:LTD domain-containing protein n=1 Tax=Ursus maritimus TaxID=29073 RepID=A0A452TG89_URSMA